MHHADGKNALFVAAEMGSTEIAQSLIAAGASLEIKDRCGNTALIAAAYCDSTEIAKSLIAAGASLEI